MPTPRTITAGKNVVQYEPPMPGLENSANPSAAMSCGFDGESALRVEDLREFAGEKVFELLDVHRRRLHGTLPQLTCAGRATP